MRGFKKKRRRTEKKAERYAAAEVPMDSGQEPGDWWDGFSRRITGGKCKAIRKDVESFQWECSVIC